MAFLVHEIRWIAAMCGFPDPAIDTSAPSSTVRKASSRDRFWPKNSVLPKGTFPVLRSNFPNGTFDAFPHSRPSHG